MKTITSDLNDHAAQSTTSFATCWKVVRTDDEIFGFTDHDKDLTVPVGVGVLYKARTGYTRTTIETSSSLAVDNLDLEGIFDDASITELDIVAGLWDYADVEIFQVNWADLTQGVCKMRKGRLGEVKAGRSTFVTELRGLLQNVQQEVGRVFGPQCDADLFDARCAVDPIAFTDTAAVTAVTSRRVFAASSLSRADGFFDAGKVTFTSGDNNGLSMEVKLSLNAGGAIQLQLPMPFDVQVGDTFTIRAGCAEKSLSMCRDKFSNVINFRGFPYVPGTDQMVKGR